MSRIDEWTRDAKLEALLYECILELNYVQSSFESCGSDLCASAKGKELIVCGMELLGVEDLSGESWATAKRKP